MFAKGKTACLSMLILLIFAGCQRRQEPSPTTPDAPQVDRGKFGDPYQIVGNFNQADPDLYPMLSGDTLTVRVTYSGGCESHDLDVKHEVEGDTGFVWIRHDARGDLCEALISDEVEVTLPDRVTNASVVALLHPQGGPPQILDTR